MVPIIETARLRLRGWEEKDFSAYRLHRSSAERQAFVGGAATGEEAWDEFCAMIGVWALRAYGTFAVAMRGDDRPVGYTGLWFPPDIDEPELCWSLFPGAEGCGYATEAARAARDWAYTARGMPALMRASCILITAPRKRWPSGWELISKVRRRCAVLHG